MMKSAALIAFTALFVASTSATRAGEAECKAVTDALTLMTEQPAVRQVNVVEEMPGFQEMVFTQEAMFINAAGGWKRMDVPGARRRAEMQTILTVVPLQDCAKGELRDIGNAATVLFRYRQPRLDKPSEIIDYRLWIGSDDGLPYRMEAATTVQTMDYTGFEVPSP